MIFRFQDQAWKAWVRLRERLPHAILIQSGEGMGEFEFAHACAQSLLCEKPGPDRKACGSCRACSWFSQGNHPDFRLIVPESMAPESREEGAEPAKKKSEQIRIEQVRELADFLAVGTHRGGLRVLLVYPAEAMNANTQNALLKSLEEPPGSSAMRFAYLRSSLPRGRRGGRADRPDAFRPRGSLRARAPVRCGSARSSFSPARRPPPGIRAPCSRARSAGNPGGCPAKTSCRRGSCRMLSGPARAFRRAATGRTHGQIRIRPCPPRSVSRSHGAIAPATEPRLFKLDPGS